MRSIGRWSSSCIQRLFPMRRCGPRNVGEIVALTDETEQELEVRDVEDGHGLDPSRCSDRQLDERRRKTEASRATGAVRARSDDSSSAGARHQTRNQ
jgi:hypothetical protein